MGSQKSGVKGQNPLPCPAGHAALMQPRARLAFWAANAHCWLTLSFSPTSTPKSFSSGLLSSRSPPSLCLCLGCPARLWCARDGGMLGTDPARGSSSLCSPVPQPNPKCEGQPSLVFLKKESCCGYGGLKPPSTSAAFTRLCNKSSPVPLLLSDPLARHRLRTKTSLQPSRWLLEMRHKFLALSFKHTLLPANVCKLAAQTLYAFRCEQTAI